MRTYTLEQLEDAATKRDLLARLGLKPETQEFVANVLGLPPVTDVTPAAAPVVTSVGDIPPWYPKAPRQPATDVAERDWHATRETE